MSLSIAMKLRHPLSGWEVDAKVDEYEYEELSRLRYNLTLHDWRCHLALSDRVSGFLP
jgi:hypothetical protein